MQDPLNGLRQTQLYRVANEQRGHLVFLNPPIADHTPVRITGGIGDLIMGLGVAEELNRKLGDVVVYSKYPDIQKMFSKLPAKPEGAILKHGFDWHITINQVGIFHFQHNFRGFNNFKLNDILIKHKAFVSQMDLGAVVNSHPLLDNVLADKATKMGHTRDTITYKFFGLDHRPTLHSQFGKEYDGGPYITIHDGYDSNNAWVKDRATKTWGMDQWREFVYLFKSMYPDVHVYQLGGKKSRVIHGADSYYVDRLSFEGSMYILQHSMCHVDGDSGLVHAANRFGVESVVMFGPTPADYFGYKSNANIHPRYCGNCFWLNEDWNERCQLGHSTPKCMDSIDPIEVLGAVSSIIAEERKYYGTKHELHV